MEKLTSNELNEGEWLVAITREHPRQEKLVPVHTLRNGWAPGSDPFNGIGIDRLPEQMGDKPMEPDPAVAAEIAGLKHQLANLMQALAAMAPKPPEPPTTIDGKKAAAIAAIREASRARRQTLLGTAEQELAWRRRVEVSHNAKIGRPDAVELMMELAEVRNRKWLEVCDETIARDDRCTAASMHINSLELGAIDDIAVQDVATDEQIALIRDTAIGAINAIDTKGAEHG